MRKLAVAWPWLAAICSGLLYTSCFAPFNLTWLCWIALAPLITALRFSGRQSRHPWLRNLTLGYRTRLGFFRPAEPCLTTDRPLARFVHPPYRAGTVARP